jgi:hypothetical protein
MTVKKRAAFVMAAALATGGLLLGSAGVAAADPVKNCGTTTTEVGPGKSGMTETQTETQTSACNSASDQGEVITTGPVTNRGGGTPPGQQ